MQAVRMSFEKRAPSLDRLHPLGNSIVQILVDICSGDWVDGNHAHFSLCRREHLADDDVDVIKPSELCDVVTGQRRVRIHHRSSQRQNEPVFPNKAHAAPFKPPASKYFHAGAPHVNSHSSLRVPS
jgi:hypothetical protein